MENGNYDFQSKEANKTDFKFDLLNALLNVV